ncbi:hypothetical protein [Chitinophaga arvensicola]|uniref:Uncharacterized protein n=1 Tax=Chitinophaga arvensicola TaxID=29529 RepID=A0A1I0PPI7_9BACT|nr:hypothetical protein [Chitinophaga arvensicola]SEW16233.1 hypothetical protein SAMN04488122_0897 [Chitinophaga arvensicola]
MENTNHPTASNLSQSFTVHVDESGSWLKVTIANLITLSLTERISNASFKKGKYAYLEYPDDAYKFIRAWLTAHSCNSEDFSYFESFVTIQNDGKFSWIKRLHHYKP